MVAGWSTSVGVAKLHSTPSCIISDIIPGSGGSFVTAGSWVQCSLSSQSDSCTQPKGAVLSGTPQTSYDSGFHHFIGKSLALGEGFNIPAWIWGSTIWGFGDLDTTTTPGHPKKDQAFPQDQCFLQDLIHHSNRTATTDQDWFQATLCVFIAFIVISLLNCNSDLKSLTRCFCGVNSSPASLPSNQHKFTHRREKREKLNFCTVKRHCLKSFSSHPFWALHWFSWAMRVPVLKRYSGHPSHNSLVL